MTASKRNRPGPTPIDINRVRQIVITFDDDHLPADIVVEFKNGTTVSVDSIEETYLSDEHRSDWISFAGYFGEPNLMVEVAIPGGRR